MQETELEAAFAEGKERLELLIAGHIYVVDLHLMLQYRKDQPARRRTIKRNRSSIAIDIKGIAGLRIEWIVDTVFIQRQQFIHN